MMWCGEWKNQIRQHVKKHDERDEKKTSPTTRFLAFDMCTQISAGSVDSGRALG